MLAAVFCPTTKKRQMIKANEIRVGNFINEKVLGNVKILEIHTKVVIVESINLTVNKEKIAQQYTLSLNHIEPIKLTDDILFNYGFEKGKNNWFGLKYITNCTEQLEEMKIDYNLISKRLSIYDAIEETDMINILSYPIYAAKKIKYLHELQNIYLSLTGQELSVVANGS